MPFFATFVSTNMYMWKNAVLKMIARIRIIEQWGGKSDFGTHRFHCSKRLMEAMRWRIAPYSAIFIVDDPNAVYTLHDYGQTPHTATLLGIDGLQGVNASYQLPARARTGA